MAVMPKIPATAVMSVATASVFVTKVGSKVTSATPPTNVEQASTVSLLPMEAPVALVLVAPLRAKVEVLVSTVALASPVTNVCVHRAERSASKSNPIATGLATPAGPVAS